MKIKTLLLSLTIYLQCLNLTAQLSSANGTINPTTNPSTGNVGVGTATPNSKLEIVGDLKATKAIFPGKELNNEIFSTWDEGVEKSIVFSAGKTIPGSSKIRVFSMHDMSMGSPHNINGVFFDMFDRTGKKRFNVSLYNELTNATEFVLKDQLEREIFKVKDYGDSKGAYVQIPKANTKFIIGGYSGDAIIGSHKFVVKGSSLIQGNIITDSSVGIGTTSPTSKLSVYGKNSDGWNSGLELNREDGGKGLIVADSQGMKFKTPVNGQHFHFRDNDNKTSLFIKDGGNIGIGTTSPSGKLHVKGETYVDGGWLRVLGQKGLYFQNHGGGLYMTDNTWIRTYGNKNFYHNTGIMRTDGAFQVGSGGSRFSVRTDGKVGVGVTVPTQKLDVNGTILSRGGLQINGTDFQLGLNNSRDKGTKTAQRALVHSTLDRLFVNYGGDFEGGVQINGPKTIIDGNVGIGTTNPDSKLSVNGKIHAREVKVDLIGWSDFVFYKDYNLPTLKQVENHIKEKGHLQDIPSAKEVAKKGVFLGEMNAKLLQKIEELTLYTIDQEKRLKAQNAKNSDLESRLTRLEELLKTSKEK